MNKSYSWLAFVAAAVCVGPGGASAQTADHQDHSEHRKMVKENPARYETTTETYTAPDIVLEDHNGNETPLASLLESPEPVALNFIFTTCTTICPVMTATFAHMLSELGPQADGLRMVSISIDPEYDSPGVLKQYAERYKARPDWRFLTGDAKQIVAVLKAFDAYTGSKGSHRPITLMKGPGSDHWLRIDGLASGADLSTEYRRLLGES